MSNLLEFADAGWKDKMQMHEKVTKLMGRASFSRRQRSSNMATLSQPALGQLFHHPAAPAQLDSKVGEVSGGGVRMRCASHESSKKSDDWLAVVDDSTECAIGLPANGLT
jgi:hypothetical protein